MLPLQGIPLDDLELDEGPLVPPPAGSSLASVVEGDHGFYRTPSGLTMWSTYLIGIVVIYGYYMCRKVLLFTRGVVGKFRSIALAAAMERTLALDIVFVCLVPL